MITLDFLKVKKCMKICSKTHHLKKIRGSMHPNPPCKRMATPRVASPPPSPPKKCWPPLANPAYVYELLLKKLFENPPCQTVDCV